MTFAGGREVEIVEAIGRVVIMEDTAMPTVLIELSWPVSSCFFSRRRLWIGGIFSSPDLPSGVVVRALHNHG